MTNTQAKIITWSVVIISGIYTVPLLAIAKLGEYLQRLKPLIINLNNRIWSKNTLLTKAIEVRMLEELEQRKESVRRKRGMVQGAGTTGKITKYL